MVREEIKNLIEKAVRNLYRKEVEVKIERPAEMAYGDYATNVAMTLTKNPQEIADFIKYRAKRGEEEDEVLFAPPILEKVEVKNGFINFFLSKEYLQKQVEEILKQEDKFGQLKIGNGQKAQVEFISANPTGPLHIGNGRGAFFGDTISNVLEKAGYKVTREYYINDAKVNTQIKTLGQTALGEGVTYLNDYLKEKISNLKSKLEKISDEGEAGYLLAQEVQKDNKDFIGKKLKIKFDNWVSENDLYKINKVNKIYNWLKNENLIYKKEGAEWLKTSQFGDKQDWVIIRETGEPTYLLSDIAYHRDKFKRGFQKIINIWGADHQGHVGKIKAVAKILNYKWDLDILISQVVRLKGGKISKRKGVVVTLEWLINEVGLDATRFFYLMKSLDTQMEFDVGLAKERSAKSPVYYVQYAYARIHSILAKSKINHSPFPMGWVAQPFNKGCGKNQKSKVDYKLLNHPSELELIKQLIRFPETVEDTAKDYQIQRLPQYAIDLATVFHQFYRDCQVLTEVKPLREARLALILATRTVLKNTLNVMGISAPEHM
ncbi:MAG: hypothetical protein AUK06_02580 [Parcubacteria group bacterium CG2_30_36_18]|uniref:Arginine--tRNA ligase n=4 Tax=Candidatus Nealsoniibacteriota TaxID=1817911 RepID=A0A2M8DL65_9BACT|nr:MAG: hypothetical protein AUK06_02580 [Parcubacteria group bacterium CG2_30_36_18]PIP24776.1 MAG: arginine--tRNA ligase [Candidatus Nealsonbacteria bacterium CG23_combo_of_CG06-09_8_20_14_all_36_125]PIR72052.1 MAG: arginine--tRNA ligase [Candidatus Nealsonbacteria bacterium CG10_big_fil_rev_8_21_14_0_10_36_228]PIX88703.1 MAG: arginine--tRNA ligase [Candidatus Nealsonbacteria bacterium CG_4_10_14_3_um_filter_36_16]PJB98514.1 MAG: arginine--tRNA ligase [Candidatus Nealsonbacteria bacterium CG_